MDLVISGGGDSLLDSLSFDLPPSSSYIQNKRYVSYYPSGASTYSPTGVRVMRFNIVGEGWLDPDSLRITGKLANTGATVLQLADGPHSMIQRAKLSIAGNVCEDLDMYNRNHNLFRRILTPTSFNCNDIVESGLQRYQEGAPNSNSPSIVEEQLASGKYAAFNFQPLFGLCNCNKLLPIRLSGGITIELTLADADAAVIAGSSTSYELQEMSIRCSVVKLDSALESSFASMLMQNKSLSLRFNTHSCQAMVLQPGSTEMNVSLVRAYSRLNALFISFQGGAGAPSANTHQTTSFLNPSQFIVGGVVAGATTHDEATLQWDVQIGATKWPESPAKSIPKPSVCSVWLHTSTTNL